MSTEEISNISSASSAMGHPKPAFHFLPPPIDIPRGYVHHRQPQGFERAPFCFQDRSGNGCRGCSAICEPYFHCMMAIIVNHDFLAPNYPSLTRQNVPELGKGHQTITGVYTGYLIIKYIIHKVIKGYKWKVYQSGIFARRLGTGASASVPGSFALFKLPALYRIREDALILC